MVISPPDGYQFSLEAESDFARVWPQGPEAPALATFKIEAESWHGHWHWRVIPYTVNDRGEKSLGAPLVDQRGGPGELDPLSRLLDFLFGPETAE